MPTRHSEIAKIPFHVIAHRGFRAHYAENTLVSFEKALASGANMFELDVRMTNDEVVVILHDPTILRLGGQRLHVSAMTWDQLKQINLMDKKARHLKSGSVLSLEQLFSTFGSDVYYDVEVKICKYHTLQHKHTLCSKVIELVNRFDLGNHVMATSFELEILQFLKDKNNVTLGFNFSRELPDEWLLEKLQGLDVRLCPHHKLLNEEVLHNFRERGFKVIPWVVNRQKRSLELLYWGVDGIITDNPETLVSLLDSLSPNPYDYVLP